MKTAECVSPKHPDKICDQISDAILDWCISKDPNARVAIETMGGHGKVYITGEITIKEESVYSYDFYREVHSIVKRIAGQLNDIQINIVKQSPEIANGVDTGGAGDQGIMVGYACNDNEEMVPQEYYLARSLCRFIYEKYPYDGKTQITLGDDSNISTIVASFQNAHSYDLRELVDEWIDKMKYPHAGCIIHCNPAGDWNQGGFDSDTGLTGRKLAVDNYGPQIPIGGGAFSGKDSTKVDRSGAYMARHLAVGILKEEKAKEVTVKLAYSIGVAKPVMATAEITSMVDGYNVTRTVDLFEVYDEDGETMTPKAMIEKLKLREPIFEKTAQWGHFGEGFEWDK